MTDNLQPGSITVESPSFSSDAIGQPPVATLARAFDVEDDGSPVQEGIFSNTNDGVVLEVDGGTLVGRSAPDRGPAERITVESPLMLDNLQLRLSDALMQNMLDAVNEQITSLEDQVAALRARVESGL